MLGLSVLATARTPVHPNHPHPTLSRRSGRGDCRCFAGKPRLPSCYTPPTARTRSLDGSLTRRAARTKKGSTDHGPGAHRRAAARRHQRGRRAQGADPLHQPEARRARLPDRGGRQPDGVPRGRARPARRLSRVQPAAGRVPLPGRPADPGLPRRAPGRRAARRAGPAAAPHVRRRPPRAGARAVPADRRGRIQERPRSRATAPARACCTTRGATAAPPRATFHVAEGGLPIPATRRPSRWQVFAALLRARPQPAGGPAASCRSRPISRSPAEVFVSLLLRPIVCPEVPGVSPREDDGDPLLRARRAGQQPRLRRVDLRQRRRPVPARERRGARRRALDRPHRLRHPRAAPDRS